MVLGSGVDHCGSLTAIVQVASETLKLIMDATQFTCTGQHLIKLSLNLWPRAQAREPGGRVGPKFTSFQAYKLDINVG
jgi:hypothetical protein